MDSTESNLTKMSQVNHFCNIMNGVSCAVHSFTTFQNRQLSPLQGTFLNVSKWFIFLCTVLSFQNRHFYGEI